MSINRLTRVNELLRREIGEVLLRVFADRSIDSSAVTVTRVIASSDLRSARVWVSILGSEEDRIRLFNLIRRHRVSIQKRVSRDVVLKYTPRLHFELDRSLETGDAVLKILSELDTESEPELEPGTDEPTIRES